MTDQDRQYMVDVDDPNLAAFLRWHHDATDRGLFRGMSWYAQIKMAWMAAKNSMRQPDLAPSRDVLPPAPPPKRSFNPDFELRVKQGDQVHITSPQPVAFAHQQAAPKPVAWGPPVEQRPGYRVERVDSWPQRDPDAHREAQRFVETQAMPALTADPFAKVRLSGPQQAALDRMYPEPGFQTMDLPVVGPAERIGDHRREQMEARYAGLRDFGPPGPVMTPLQALPEADDGA